ncbi:MAG: GNAT family N-acetyltransferase [archaeon]|nr:GNAT family N-acetyltransferase [archaeon]MCP8314743.1 GNAT family N-acetyltransferase [archaeon]MCP8315462.1 GNAT family N-acetyltransferase [archaeon]MCP8320531.1 GNAT family N-acetyltransferase [archaeon]
MIIKKLTISDIESLDVTEGFTWSVKSSGEKGKVELKEFLRQKLLDGADVLIALDENKIIGFAIINDWRALPNAKSLDAMEVARPYREKGVGSMIMQRLIEEWDTLIALTLLPEPGYEKILDKFYQKFGFKSITSDIMVRIPSDGKLKEWIDYMEDVLKEYSYKIYRIQPIIHIWMQYVEKLLDVYEPLLKEMKMRIKEKS